MGASVGGTICDKTGRKKAIFITDVMFIIGALALFMSQSFSQVLIGRVLIGFAVAVSGIADVAYLHEISPVEWRGSIVSVNEACISFGFLVSYIVGYGINQVNEVDGWRYMFGAGSIIAILQFVGMLYMPESPVWLKGQGRMDEAKIALSLMSQDDGSIKGAYSNREENGTIEDYGLDHPNESDDQLDEGPPEYSSFQLGHVAHHTNDERVITSEDGILQEFRQCHRQVIIAAFLSIMQQFCGHLNVLNYAPEIFDQVGIPSLFSTVLLGVLKFCVTCFVILKIEKFGRKYLLLLGIGIIALSLLLISISFASQDESGTMTKASQIAAIIGIFGVAGGYAFR